MKLNPVFVGCIFVGCNASKGDIDRSRCGKEMTLCTIAGTGAPGYNGQDNLATELKLTYPSALILDPSGRLMVSDAGNFLIRRFDGDQLNSVVGSHRKGLAIEELALLETPIDFVMDMKFSDDGRMAMLEADGRQLSLVDFDADKLDVIAYSEEGWNSEDVTPIEDVQFSSPSSFAYDDAGNMYVADAGLEVNMILKIDPVEGVVTKVAGVDDFGFPLSSTSTDEFALQNHLKNPQGLLWRDGKLWVADTGRHRIITIDVETGEATNVSGISDAYGYGDDVPLAEARLNSPSRFTFDSSGRIIIADTGNGVIRAELNDGTIDTICGRGAGDYDPNPQDPEGASLDQPFDLLYEPNGDLVFTDIGHGVVRRISQPDW